MAEKSCFASELGEDFFGVPYARAREAAIKRAWVIRLRGVG